MSKALRSGELPPFRDIDFSFLQKVATAFRDGRDKYEIPQGLPPWEKNWRKGDREFFLKAIDHAIRHLYLFKERMVLGLGEDTLCPIPDEELHEDHLGHVGANLVMLSYWEEQEQRFQEQCLNELKAIPEVSASDLEVSASDPLGDDVPVSKVNALDTPFWKNILSSLRGEA